MLDIVFQSDLAAAEDFRIFAISLDLSVNESLLVMWLH